MVDRRVLAILALLAARHVAVDAVLLEPRLALARQTGPGHPVVDDRRGHVHLEVLHVDGDPGLGRAGDEGGVLVEKCDLVSGTIDTIQDNVS